MDYAFSELERVAANSDARVAKAHAAARREKAALVRAALSSLRQLRGHLTETLSGLRGPKLNAFDNTDGLAFRQWQHRWGAVFADGQTVVVHTDGAPAEGGAVGHGRLTERPASARVHLPSPRRVLLTSPRALKGSLTAAPHELLGPAPMDRGGTVAQGSCSPLTSLLAVGSVTSPRTQPTAEVGRAGSAPGGRGGGTHAYANVHGGGGATSRPVSASSTVAGSGHAAAVRVAGGRPLLGTATPLSNACAETNRQVQQQQQQQQQQQAGGDGLPPTVVTGCRLGISVPATVAGTPAGRLPPSRPTSPLRPNSPDGSPMGARTGGLSSLAHVEEVAPTVPRKAAAVNVVAVGSPGKLHVGGALIAHTSVTQKADANVAASHLNMRGQAQG